MTRAEIATGVTAAAYLCLGIGLLLWLAQGALIPESTGAFDFGIAAVAIHVAQLGSVSLAACLLLVRRLLRSRTQYSCLAFFLVAIVLLSIALNIFNRPLFGLSLDSNRWLAMILGATGLSGIFTGLVLLAAQVTARKESASESTTSG